MHILLINPFFDYAGNDKFPLGIGYLAAIARMASQRVTVIDENVGDTVPWEDFRQFDVIGISVTTPALSRVRALITQMQAKKATHACIIVGGHHPTFRPEDMLRAGADIAVRGEGEEIFLQVVNALNNKRDRREWRTIPGISYMMESGEFQHNPLTGLNNNLDSLPFPAWDLFRYKKYNPMSVITSRGCPHHCSYCSAAAFWQHSVRFRSISNIIQELDKLLALYPFPFLKFQDSVFTAPKNRINQLLSAIVERHYSFQWTCETRADALNEELINLMARANCKTIMLGLESGSQAVLDRNERKMKVDAFREICLKIKERRLGIRISVVFGLPGESKDTVEETLDLLRHIQPNVTFMNLATAYPGCALETSKVAPHKDQWVRTFGGHGLGGQLVLPEGMTAGQYHRLADYLYREIHKLNKINWVKISEI